MSFVESLRFTTMAADVLLSPLLPSGEDIEPQTLVQGLDLAAQSPTDRPYTLVNFITTADGHAAFQGRSAPLGDQGDRALFHALREQADAILAGTVTMTVERYGRIIGDPEHRQRRVAQGRSPEPLACVISRSGRVPWDIPLFAEPEAEVVVFSPAAPGRTVAARVHHEPLDPRDPAPLSTAMRTLRQKYEVRSLLCEGGPTLFGSLLGERLVDELFLTVAPKLTGGASGPAITSGPPLPELAGLRLVWLLEREASLFLRYALI